MLQNTRNQCHHKISQERYFSRLDSLLLKTFHYPGVFSNCDVGVSSIINIRNGCKVQGCWFEPWAISNENEIMQYAETLQYENVSLLIISTRVHKQTSFTTKQS